MLNGHGAVAEETQGQAEFMGMRNWIRKESYTVEK